MRPATPEFRKAINQSHKLAVEILVRSPAGTLLAVFNDPIVITAGSVTLDHNAATRGRIDLTLVDDSTLNLVPNKPSSLLAPCGNQIVVKRGIEYPNGLRELIQLGVFRIDRTVVNDSGNDLSIQVAALDRSSIVIDARFEEPYQIAAGTLVETAIFNLVKEAVSDVVADFPGTGFVTPAVIGEEGGDRWALAQGLAKASGLLLYFDGDGRLKLVPQPSGGPVATLSEGEKGVLLQAGREWTRQGAYNRIIATGENTAEVTPVRGVATDLNPASAMYYHGAFGKVPGFYSSQFIVTAAQAQAAAETMLNLQLGTMEVVNFGALVDPTLEPGDVVRITRARAGIDEDHAIDQLTIPLSANDTMTGVTRVRQIQGVTVSAP